MGSKALDTLREKVHRKCLLWRALDRLVFSPEFKDRFDASNVELMSAIERCDVEWLEAFLSRKEGLQGIPNKQLRKMAQARKIKDYQHLPKDVLIREIEKHDSGTPQDVGGMPCGSGEEQSSGHPDDSGCSLSFDANVRGVRADHSAIGA